MNSAEEVFAVWAPEESPWSLWAKPVLFAQMSPVMIFQQEGREPMAMGAIPPWLPSSSQRVALVIDCPGALSVELGLAAASAGYRPVPLFNALPGSAGTLSHPSTDPMAAPVQFPIAIVDVWPIISALLLATPQLAGMKLPADAPPAFLLDSNRRSGVGPLIPNRFDNRSVSFPTDFPSASFLLSQGIKSALLIQQATTGPEADLSHTLLRWQKGGIPLQSVELGSAYGPGNCVINRPSFFGRVWYRLSLMAGLRPVLGGFGGMIPEPSSGGGG